MSSTAIDSTFSFIRHFSVKGSLVIFDYVNAGVLRKENKYHGEKDIFKTVSRAGETWTFALEEGEIESFLGHYGFSLKDHSNALQLEKKYFRNPEGKILGKINGTHNIAIGSRRSSTALRYQGQIVITSPAMCGILPIGATRRNFS